eukprot:scaffold15379_cov133-Isochrysis_galbana.AAC.6
MTYSMRRATELQYGQREFDTLWLGGGGGVQDTYTIDSTAPQLWAARQNLGWMEDGGEGGQQWPSPAQPPRALSVLGSRLDVHRLVDPPKTAECGCVDQVNGAAATGTQVEAGVRLGSDRTFGDCELETAL